jgi:hypothetical protein
MQVLEVYRKRTRENFRGNTRVKNFRYFAAVLAMSDSGWGKYGRSTPLSYSLGMTLFNQLAQTDLEVFIACYYLSSIIGAPNNIYDIEILQHDFEDPKTDKDRILDHVQFILQTEGESVTIPTSVAYIGVFSYLFPSIDKESCETIAMALSTVPETYDYYSDILAASIVFYLDPDMNSIASLYYRKESLVNEISSWLELAPKFYRFDPRDLIMDYTYHNIPVSKGKLSDKGIRYPTIEIGEGKIIGGGGQGRVYAWKGYAVKVTETKDMLESSLNEIISLISLKHENVISLESFRVGVESTMVVLELARTSLHDILYPSRKIFGNTQQAWEDVYLRGKIRDSGLSRYVTDLLKGLSYIHSQGICDLDIKPENLLVTNDDTVVITDLGTARHFAHTSRTGWVGTGTPYYRDLRLNKLFVKYHNVWPPLTVERSYEVDIWAAGLTIVEILTGVMMLFTPPSSPEEMAKNIVKKTYQVLSVKETFLCISNPDIRRLVRQMLEPNRDLRITAKQALALVS